MDESAETMFALSISLLSSYIRSQGANGQTGALVLAVKNRRANSNRLRPTSLEKPNSLRLPIVSAVNAGSGNRFWFLISIFSNNVMASIPDRFKNAPISRTVGFDVDVDEHGDVVVELEVTPDHWNPMGRLQGGVLAVLADASMGIAYGRELSENCEFSTIDFTINYMRPVRTGKVRAVGRLIQRGTSVGFLECHVWNQRNKLVATATCSCLTLPQENTANGESKS